MSGSKDEKLNELNAIYRKYAHNEYQQLSPEASQSSAGVAQKTNKEQNVAGGPCKNEYIY